MKLSAFLSPSRHGVYYFRWPLPSPDRQSRRTVRISLRTKCPDRAGDLARHLASCGRLVRDNKALARLRQDEMREMVRSYFAASLDAYVEKLNDTGLPDRSLDALRQELAAHEDAAEGHDDLSDMFLDPDAFRASAGLTDAQWAENAPSLRHEMRKARRDQIRELLSRAESLEGYSFTEHAQTLPKPSQARSASLSAAIADFKAEHGPQWSQEMRNKADAYLALLVGHFGPDRPMDQISRQDAADMKKLVQALPANRKTKPETRDLSLQDAIAVPGLPKMGVKTVNSYIDMFRRFWDWAERHGRAPHKLFDGMKVAKAKQAAEKRKAYRKEQLSRLYVELTENRFGLVKKDDHKWGTLLAMFTGARLREVAQLVPSDIRNEGGIWYIDINADGEKKSLKSPAAKRRVPVHSELIRLGFLEWVEGSAKQPRLFMSFSHNDKEGYGRNLGRWFNNTFLPGLKMKEDGLVFHSLRHTAITRMRQASVELSLVQEIVGHERDTVTDGYFGEGYTLAQKKDAIERITAR
ncbi:Phage integrase family protein [Rhodovulum sp. ES.010]|uniref:site-specific integrase n=1 Tax=Rhodovulum sp. ES.010 TaxID=1882821 RepID=UPI0009296889|nr:site-specific integrase [Rhodovulum sp. ES.010]SIO26025.1 Phage integrase family protein [Rhodovulum sp. ES.010]